MIRVIFLICLLVSSCSTINNNIEIKNHTQYYYDLSAVDYDKRDNVRDAIKYFDDTIDCISLKELNDDSIKNHRIYFISINYLPDPIIGNNSEMFDLELVFLSRRDIEDGKLKPISNNKTYKLILHELAHVMGMPAEHPFPKTISNKSLLTPEIGDASPDKFSEDDVQYLQKTICK